MAEEWGGGPEDPFADSADPEAAARAQRRREREARRAARQGQEALGPQGEPSASPPPPPPPPQPPVPSRTAEEEFWDEELEPLAEDEIEEEASWGGAAARESAPAAGSDGPRGPRPAGVLATLRRHPFRLAGAILGLLALWFLVELFQPFHGDGSGRVVMTIPKGASISEVGDLLEGEGVVSSSLLFQIRARLDGASIYPGRFVLAHDMSYGAAIDAVSKPALRKETTITVPEGYGRRQIAALAREVGLGGDYMKESVRSRYLDPAEYGGKDARSLEGFLFPDTFVLKPGAPAADLVQLQLQDFKRRIKGVDMRYAHSKNLTVYDVVTIASMVQAESGVLRQDGLVAAVIYNRLREGMPLGIDATVRFATGNYDRPLTESELATESPYNTRLHAGLPPGPISNPGLAAIEAAAHPAKAGYRFYVTKPGACNELAFAKTEAEFEEDVAKYDSARKAAGDNSPTTCP
jgi:peptidoglycan lytic transglycosylase G